MYEIVWSRQLVLVFGNTTQAVSAILTGFFGGMADRGRGRRPHRRPGPLAAAPLRRSSSCILVVVVLVTPISFGLIREVYRGIYPSLEGSPALLATVRLVLAVAALAPATVLMGATFPSLTRYLARTSALSRAFGRLYAANTIGAIVGTLAAGLVLIELLGLSGALAVGAGCSAIAGVDGPLARARRRRRRTAADGAVAAEPPAIAPRTTRAKPTHRARLVRAGLVPRPQLALAIAFISGLTSLALPGHLDAAAGVRDRQHDLRLHGDPRDVPDGHRHRRGHLQRHPRRASGIRCGCWPLSQILVAALRAARARARARSAARRSTRCKPHRDAARRCFGRR